MKAVLFDLDETLLDRSQSLKRFASWQAQGMLRSSISDEIAFSERFIELDSNGRVWKDKVYSQLVEEFSISDWTVAELLKSYELCFSDFSRLKPNALEALETLHRGGYKLGLVSNGMSPFQERNFNALGVSSLFSTVIVSDAVGYRKPDKKIFLLACDSLCVQPLETVFVGDNPSDDIDGANDCGMYTIYIPSHHGESYENADEICRDFSDLVGIVKNAG